MTLRLYELADMYKRLLELGEDGIEVRVCLDSIGEDLETKAINTAKAIRCLEGESLAYGAEIRRMKEHADAVDSRVRALRQYLIDNLGVVGLTEVKGDVLRVKVQASPFSCRIIDETAIPEQYCERVVVTHYDSKAIIDAVKAGQDVPGAVVAQGKHIRIYP